MCTCIAVQVQYKYTCTTTGILVHVVATVRTTRQPTANTYTFLELARTYRIISYDGTGVSALVDVAYTTHKVHLPRSWI